MHAPHALHALHTPLRCTCPLRRPVDTRLGTPYVIAPAASGRSAGHAHSEHSDAVRSTRPASSHPPAQAQGVRSREPSFRRTGQLVVRGRVGWASATVCRARTHLSGTQRTHNAACTYQPSSAAWQPASLGACVSCLRSRNARRVPFSSVRASGPRLDHTIRRGRVGSPSRRVDLLVQVVVQLTT